MAITTKRALAGSLKKLLSKRSLDKITIKDIVEDCGVNRQTFYYYFHDIYDLMEWIFQDEADDLIRGLDYEDWISGVGTVMRHLMEERALVLNAYNSVSHAALNRNLNRLMRPYFLQVVRRQAETMESPAEEEDVEFVTDIYTLTAVGVLMEWVGNRMQVEGTEERLQKFYAALSGSICFMLHNLSQRRQEQLKLSGA